MRLLGLWWGLFWWTILSFGSAFGGSSSLRDSQTECGLYFADPLGMQGEKISDLDPQKFSEGLSEYLAKNQSVVDMHLAIVGVAPAEKEVLETSLRKTLTELGFKDVPVTVIRRLRDFIANETGFFVRDEDFSWRRISSADPTSMRAALEEFGDASEREFLLVGIPQFGSDRQAVNHVLSDAKLNKVTDVGPWQAAFNKAVANPSLALDHAKENIRHFFPVREDFVRPTSGELRAAFEKILIPGALTFSVMMAQGQALEVLIPVTIMNAANSYSNGAFRGSIGNWWRRSKSFFPSMWLKNTIVSGFFTTTLYWVGRGSWREFAQIATFMGWQNYVMSKWLSVLFTTSWRTPVHSAVFRWEEKKLKEATAEEANKIRQAGAAVEKYISYGMTQLFLYSIISKHSLFHVSFDPSRGFGLAGGIFDPMHAQAGERLLMDFNMGHLAMASLGAAALVIMKNMAVLDKVAHYSLKLDQIESKFVGQLIKPWTWFRNWLAGGKQQ